MTSGESIFSTSLEFQVLSFELNEKGRDWFAAFVFGLYSDWKPETTFAVCSGGV